MKNKTLGFGVFALALLAISVAAFAASETGKTTQEAFVADGTPDLTSDITILNPTHIFNTAGERQIAVRRIVKNIGTAPSMNYKLKLKLNGQPVNEAAFKALAAGATAQKTEKIYLKPGVNTLDTVVEPYLLDCPFNNDAAGYIFVSSQKGAKQPAILDVIGPSMVGNSQSGTWTVKAYHPDGKPLTFGVEWGDGIGTQHKVQADATMSPVPTVRKFTHTYPDNSVRTAKFTVSDGRGTAYAFVRINVGAYCMDGASSLPKAS